jgi:hypothetical protein
MGRLWWGIRPGCAASSAGAKTTNRERLAVSFSRMTLATRGARAGCSLAMPCCVSGACQQPTGEDEKRTEAQEGEIPCERGAEVVADVVDAQDLVVDETLKRG